MAISNGSEEIRVALVTARPLVADILASWLDEVAFQCAIATFLSPSDLIGQEEPFDLIVLGHLLHGTADEQIPHAVRRLSSRFPDIPVIVVSDFQEAALSALCIREGGRGFIPTSLSVPVAVAALRLVLSGGTYVPVTALAADSPPAENRNPGRDDRAKTGAAHEEGEKAPYPKLDALALERLGLSPREGEILILLQSGRSNRLIASELGISENTVMVHVRHLMRKLGATNRTQAVYKARRLLSDPPDNDLPTGSGHPA